MDDSKLSTYFIKNENISVMHYLIYFNSTQSKMDGTWIYYEVLTIFEFCCILLSFAPIIFLGVLLFRHRIFHNNLQNLVKACVFEYICQLTSRSVEIYLIFYSLENGLVFYYASLIRCTCYFFVSFILPAFVAERCCASYYLKDYEKKNRYHISIIILATIISASIFLSWQYHQVTTTIYHHFSMLVINSISALMIIFIEKYNYKKFQDSSNLRKSKKEYSLNERFQISENIRVCEFLKSILNIASIFNFLSTISAAVDNFELSQFYLNFAATFFNICVLTYGSVVFILFYYLTPAFRKDLTKIFRKFRNPVSPTKGEKIERAKQLQMVAIETDTYFDQLQKQWD